MSFSGSADDNEEALRAAEEKSEKSKQTLDFVKKTLGDKVKDVRLSDNLGSHPVSVWPRRSRLSPLA